MNTVPFLLQHKFSSLSLEDKLEIKRLGRHRPEGLQITQKGKAQNRTFKAISWFEREPWLTACTEKNALFCFPCILFGMGGTGTWTRTGFDDLTHLSDRIKSHKKSSSHLTCCLQLEMLGKVEIGQQLDDGYRTAIRVHNEKVDKNRHILGKLIDCVKFCGAFELALRGHDESEESSNPGVFKGLVNFVAEIDNVMANHLATATVFKGTSKTIQNEILDALYEVYLDEVKKEIDSVKFVSVQADETTDNSCQCQVVIVLRYVVNGDIKERFISYTKTTEKTADVLTKIILDTLAPFNVKGKLIAQTYDGAATMKGSVNGVRTQVQRVYPEAHFTHCYAHQLNLVMEQACSKHSRKCKVFFANLAAFTSFFSHSPKRTAALTAYCPKRIPRTAQTRWNFNSRVVNVIHENKYALQLFFKKCIIDGEDDLVDGVEFIDWDRTTISEASRLLKYLEDEEFLFLLEFFQLLMPEVDALFKTLQTRNVSVDKVTNELREFLKSVEEARRKVDDITIQNENDDEGEEPLPRRKRSRGTSVEEEKLLIKGACKEACDTIATQAKDRFDSIEHLDVLQLVDPLKFSEYARSFPEENIERLQEIYSMISGSQLRTELRLLYSRESFRNAENCVDLYQFILQNNLKETVFEEVSKLLEIALTIPLVSAESERCFSTLGRIKTFTRNTMTNERLNALACLSIQKDMIRKTPEFNQKVIEKFAKAKERSVDFLYKSYDRLQED